MTDRPAEKNVAQEIEIAVCRLDELSVFPSVAERFLDALNRFQLSPSALAELIETDPALAAGFFLLINQRALPGGQDFDIQKAIEQLPLRLVRDRLLSLKTYSFDEKRLALRRQLIMHSICVGCCSESIAKILYPQQTSKLFYYAGLMHDIGKLALDEALPRSFSRIFEYARKERLGLCNVERKYLRIDHTILGKRLAEKWSFPRPLVEAIWLHHFNADVFPDDVSYSRISACVQAADIICRQADIGVSGSFDSPVLPMQLLNLLGVNDIQIQQVRQQLPHIVEKRCKGSALGEQVSAEGFHDTIQIFAAQLADENVRLADNNYQLQMDVFNLNFLNDFLSNLKSEADFLATARNFAVLWQKFYQTGLICLCLMPSMPAQKPEAVIVKDSGEVKTVLLKDGPDGWQAPKSIADTFKIVDAYEGFEGLFEQLDVQFDLSRTIALPLISSGKVIAVLVFELRHPAKKDQLQERFKPLINLVGKIFALARERYVQQLYAESFSQLIAAAPAGDDKYIERKYSEDGDALSSRHINLNALAEMAAGAAHELNNPLLVISGRAQMLAQNENDKQKKQALEQIQKNAAQISKIVDELFAYAKPEEPAPENVSVRQLIDEAVSLAGEKANADAENVKIEIDKKMETVYVDSSQIITALANIICNSFESYITKSGPISVSVVPDESGRFVSVAISDLGRGMDSAVLQKATFPFFSAKPAGRKRGMGLALANRLINLNKGTLSIESTPAVGTKVTILLPAANS